MIRLNGTPVYLQWLSIKTLPSKFGRKGDSFANETTLSGFEQIQKEKNKNFEDSIAYGKNRTKFVRCRWPLPTGRSKLEASILHAFNHTDLRGFS